MTPAVNQVTNRAASFHVIPAERRAFVVIEDATAKAVKKTAHWLEANPAAKAQLALGIQQAERGEVHDLGSFAEFADLECDD
ncbi:MAG: hypothetical protein ABJB66_20755 [Gemmatimonadaceae bacterium]